MNEKFFTLPKARQDQIINAGFRIFAHNTYKMTMRKGCGYGYYYYRTPYEIIWQKQGDQRSELIGQRGGILWLYRCLLYTSFRFGYALDRLVTVSSMRYRTSTSALSLSLIHILCICITRRSALEIICSIFCSVNIHVCCCYL